MDTQLWALDYGHSAMGTQLWTLSYGHSAMDTRLWTLSYGHSTMDTQLWTLIDVTTSHYYSMPTHQLVRHASSQGD